MNDDQLNKLERLAKLKEQGAITEAEFERQKAEIMGSGSIPKATPKPSMPEKKKSNGCLTVVMALVIFGALAGVVGSLSDKSDSSSSDSSSVSAPVAPPSRSEQVQAFFSAWDGSHRGLEKSIKSSMNDPESYEHVETRFRDDKSTIYVLTKFRGKNAFGGTIVNYAKGKLDGQTGELLEWEFVKE